MANIQMFSENEDKGNNRDISENTLCADNVKKIQRHLCGNLYSGKKQKISED